MSERTVGLPGLGLEVVDGEVGIEQWRQRVDPRPEHAADGIVDVPVGIFGVESAAGEQGAAVPRVAQPVSTPRRHLVEHRRVHHTHLRVRLEQVEMRVDGRTGEAAQQMPAPVGALSVGVQRLLRVQVQHHPVLTQFVAEVHQQRSEVAAAVGHHLHHPSGAGAQHIVDRRVRRVDVLGFAHAHQHRGEAGQRRHSVEQLLEEVDVERVDHHAHTGRRHLAHARSHQRPAVRRLGHHRRGEARSPAGHEV